MSNPTEIHPRALYGIPMSGGVQTTGQTLKEAGKMYPSIDGVRFLYTTSGLSAYFIQVKTNAANTGKLGKLYVQPSPSFGWDTAVGGTTEILSQTLAPTKKILKNFMEVFLGVLSVTSGPMAIAITGMNLFVEAGKIKRNFELYSNALCALVDDGFELKNTMPVFYKKVIDEMIMGRILEDAKSSGIDLMTKAVPGPKVAGKLVGFLLGRVGEDQLERRLVAIKKLIDEVLIKIAVHAITKGPHLDNKEQVEPLAKMHVIPILKKAGVYIPQDQAMEIVKETAKHAAKVEPRLKAISKGIDGLYA